MITSTTNSLVKRIRKLEQKKYRKKEGIGFVEGLRGVLTAAEQVPHLIEKVIIATELLTGDRAESRLRDLIPKEKIVEFSPEVYQAVSNRDNPAGMGALVQSPLINFEDFARPTNAARYVILDRLGDPGNLGTIVRTADAAGMNGVILVGSGVDVMHPSALKASLGTMFTVPLCHTTADAVSQWQQKNQVELIGTSAKADALHTEMQLSGTAGLLLGNEREGLSAELADLTNKMVRIPMKGQASSLNVAVAAGILIYQFA